MNYTPRVGSVPHAVIEHLQADPDTCLTSSEISARWDVPPKNVATMMKSVVAAGLLSCERQGRSYTYSLGPGESAPVEEVTATGETMPFVVSLDTDGELFIRGAQVLENGDVLLSNAMAKTLRAYLSHTAGWLDFLGTTDGQAATAAQ